MGYNCEQGYIECIQLWLKNTNISGMWSCKMPLGYDNKHRPVAV